MCGIICAIAERNVVPILLDGLKRLEYRGYDSAGIAVLNNQKIDLVKKVGKVAALEEEIINASPYGHIGIAHTRWATHGKPCEKNAHPHVINGRVAIVHNGIIENYQQIKGKLSFDDYQLASDTDTEVVAAYIYDLVKQGMDLLNAVQKTVKILEGAYALGILDAKAEDYLVATRHGSPLVIGLGLNECFLASDPLALQKVSQEFIFLEEGDIVEVHQNQIKIYDAKGKQVTREIHTRSFEFDVTDKGHYTHFMQKEIFEEPKAVAASLEGRIYNNKISEHTFGVQAMEIFDKAENIQMVACGTSYYAGLIAKHWLEEIAEIPCQVEIASEFRYRTRVVPKNTLFITISQSGETADTLAALHSITEDPKGTYCGTLTISNVPGSALMRESDLKFLTNAGPEVGVATTKAFLTQLVGLLMLVLTIAKRKQTITDKLLQEYIVTLLQLPGFVRETLKMDRNIKNIASFFEDKNHALFLGRGIYYPVALEGALKLKELSYIHAEAYPAGELKHGPLALVDKSMPVVVIAPPNNLLGKVQSNMEEVYARGGNLIVVTSENAKINKLKGTEYLILPKAPDLIMPILYVIPMQLLAYHAASLKGTDVDHPRNLAKSVTVE